MRTLLNCMAGLASVALLTAPTWAQTRQSAAGVTATTEAGAVTSLETQADQALSVLKQKNPTYASYLSSAAGYAIFPDVTAGAAGIGAAHGTGMVFEKGKRIGESTVTKVTVGAQVGGQSYSELILFETPAVLQQFKAGNYELSAAASAVAGGSGSGKSVNYKNGVAVVTFGREGLMAQASVGGQKFTYQPLVAAVGSGLPTSSGSATQGSTTPVK